MTPHDYLRNRYANQRLIRMIVEWWAKRGYRVRAWTERVDDPTTGGQIWVVRTNIKQDLKDAEQGRFIQ